MIKPTTFIRTNKSSNTNNLSKRKLMDNKAIHSGDWNSITYKTLIGLSVTCTENRREIYIENLPPFQFMRLKDRVLHLVKQSHVTPIERPRKIASSCTGQER